jgi:hypothetical protein
MHVYRILLPMSETDDSRFNSREKHMLTDSVQASAIYNKPIIDLACSICTVKYQTSACFLHGPKGVNPSQKVRGTDSKLGRSGGMLPEICLNFGTLKRYFTVQTSRSVHKPLLSVNHYI